MTFEQIEKLPKHAREYIAKLERERQLAIRQLQEHLDTVKPSQVYYEEHNPGTNKLEKHFVQSNWIYFDHAGITMRVLLREEKEIDVTWWSSGQGNGKIALVPYSNNSIHLVAFENAR